MQPYGSSIGLSGYNNASMVSFEILYHFAIGRN